MRVGIDRFQRRHVGTSSVCWRTLCVLVDGSSRIRLATRSCSGELALAKPSWLGLLSRQIRLVPGTWQCLAPFIVVHKRKIAMRHPSRCPSEGDRAQLRRLVLALPVVLFSLEGPPAFSEVYSAGAVRTCPVMG